MHDDASKVGESEPSTQCETLNINQAVQDIEDQQETGQSEPNIYQILQLCLCTCRCCNADGASCVREYWLPK